MTDMSEIFSQVRKNTQQEKLVCQGRTIHRNSTFHEGSSLDLIPNPSILQKDSYYGQLLWPEPRHRDTLEVQEFRAGPRAPSGVKSIAGTVTDTAVPANAQICLNSLSTFPFLHFRDFYGKHICSIFDCIYAGENQIGIKVNNWQIIHNSKSARCLLVPKLQKLETAHQML